MRAQLFVSRCMRVIAMESWAPLCRLAHAAGSSSSNTRARIPAHPHDRDVQVEVVTEFKSFEASSALPTAFLKFMNFICDCIVSEPTAFVIMSAGFFFPGTFAGPKCPSCTRFRALLQAKHSLLRRPIKLVRQSPLTRSPVRHNTSRRRGEDCASDALQTE